MTKNEMLKMIDGLEIYEKDYDTLLKLLNNADNRFFVKVIEELLEGNLFLQDFERIFQNDEYEDFLKENLKSQALLKLEIQRLTEYRRNILNEVYDFSIDNDKLGLLRPLETDSYKDLYELFDSEIKEDIIYQFLSVSPQDPDLVRDSKIKLLNAFNSGEITKDDILLFSESHIVPISYEYQILTKIDNEFMFENGLTEDEMKKIKALSAFFRRKVFEVGE